MIQAVIKARGGTIFTDFVGGRPSTCNVDLYTGEGALRVSAACTVDTVNTTLSAIATKGTTTLSLSDASSVVVGRRYGIGTLAGTQPREVVTVRDLASSVATLWAPTMYAHASASTFGCTRVSYAVSASDAAVLWWDGYADFTPASGDVQTEVVDCVLRKIPDNLIDETDVRQVFPKASMILDAELDMPTALLAARDEFLRYFGGKNRAFAALGADHFRRPAAMTFWLMRRYSMGEEWQAEMELMDKERDVLINKIISQIPFDNDQDGSTTGINDGGSRMIRVQRA